MLKKKLFIIGIILVIIFIGGFLLINTDFYKINKANLLFENDVCNHNEEEHPKDSLTIVSQYKCRICGKTFSYPSSPTPIICDDCARITHRCQWCGKLEE